MKKRLVGFFLLLLAVLCISSCAAGDMSAPDVGKTQETSNKPDNNENTGITHQTNEGDTPIDVPAIDTKTTVKFIGTGDVLIHSAIYWEAEEKASQKTGYEGNYYFKDMYNGVAEFIKSADIAFANHEAPIAKTAISGYPNFNAPSESGDALAELGFNVVNIANNHMFDVEHKVTGYADTIDYWTTKKDVLQIGGYKSEQDYNTVRYINADGISIAFLAYTYNPSNTNGTKMNSKSENEGYIAPFLDDDVVTEHVESAKQNADFIIVSVHWGTENQTRPNNEQERMSQLMADLGVDAIIGHHSHTIQPIEWLTGKDGNKTLCVYSLGNFISGMLNPKNNVGGFITFDIVKENGKTELQNPVFEPTVCHYDIADFTKKDVDGNPVRTNFQVYLLKDYTEDMAKKHGTRNYGTFDLNTIKQFVTSAVPSEFLPAFLK